MTTQFFVDVTGAYLGAFDGATPPEGAIAVDDAPSDARQIWNAQTKSWAAVPIAATDVDAFRDARLAAGYVDAATGKTYQTDPVSIGLMTPIGAAAGLAVVMATNPQPSFEIIAADNSVETLAPADAFALLQGRIMPWVSATMLYARTLKNAIAVGNPPADVTAGWP